MQFLIESLKIFFVENSRFKKPEQNFKMSRILLLLELLMIFKNNYEKKFTIKVFADRKLWVDI